MSNIIAAYKYESFEDYKKVINLFEKHLNLNYLHHYQQVKKEDIHSSNFISVVLSGRPWFINTPPNICKTKKEFINLCRQKLDRKFIKHSKLWLKLK